MEQQSNSNHLIQIRKIGVKQYLARKLLLLQEHEHINWERGLVQGIPALPVPRSDRGAQGEGLASPPAVYSPYRQTAC